MPRVSRVVDGEEIARRSSESLRDCFGKQGLQGVERPPS